MRPTMKCLSLTVATVMMLGGFLPLGKADDKSGDKKPALVIVRLPTDAELTIGGFTSKQRKAVREFDTPPLPPDKKFSYQLKATWREDGKEVTRETTILVRAGETTNVNLLEQKPSPPVAEKIPAPEAVAELPKKPTPMPEPEKPMPAPKTEPEKKTEVELGPIHKPKPKPEPEKKTEAKPMPPVPPPEQVPEVPSPKATLALLIPETLTLSPGATKLLPIKVVRTHCEGPVNVAFEGVPPGVELRNVTVAADKQKVYLLAAASARMEAKECEVKAIGVIGSVRQETSFQIKIAK
jgi:uncharacterized protein (TIGR03000 family)